MTTSYDWTRYAAAAFYPGFLLLFMLATVINKKAGFTKAKKKVQSRAVGAVRKGTARGILHKYFALLLGFMLQHQARRALVMHVSRKCFRPKAVRDRRRLRYEIWGG